MTDFPTITQISIDLILISRVLIAFSWGILYAIWLQHTRQGRFMAAERTWLATVIGVGVDLLIAYPADWWVVCAVIAASSLGIIGRALWNEQRQTPEKWHRNRIKWGLLDAAAVIDEIITTIIELLESGTLAPGPATQITRVLGRASHLKEIILAAQRGETVKGQ